MKTKQSAKKIISMSLATLFVGVGIYNSVVINSHPVFSDEGIRFAKRLDEMTGEIKKGRQVANDGQWVRLNPSAQKLANVVTPPVKMTKKQESKGLTAEEVKDVSVAAIQDDLDLPLVEAVSPKYYANGLGAKDIAGSVVTRGGIIESIQVSLPNHQVEISFAEMTGNIFEYDHDGQKMSGMFYQVDKNSYMVTLTNGPFEGTRLKFSSGPSADVAQAQESQAPSDSRMDYVDTYDQDREMQEQSISYNAEMAEDKPVQQ